MSSKKDNTNMDQLKQLCDKWVYKTTTSKISVDTEYRSPNFPLLIFDLFLLPIHMLRMILIYFWGSKYNLKGFQFLDVIMHSNNPYFNNENTVDNLV